MSFCGKKINEILLRLFEEKYQVPSNVIDRK